MPLTTPAKRRRLFAISSTSDFRERRSFRRRRRDRRYNWPKPQRVHRTDRPRAHREDVTNDTADAGGRALKRLDRARMIVRLDLERDGDAVADVNDAGVLLAGADEYFRRLGGERFKQRARVFVTAMLAPHDGENAQLGVARCASTEDRFSVRVFFRREIVLRDEFGCDGGFGHGRY